MLLCFGKKKLNNKKIIPCVNRIKLLFAYISHTEEVDYKDKN